MSETIYLYGFTPLQTTLPSRGLTGVGEAPVELLNAGGFFAAFARVPAESYSAEAIEARMQDLAWVAEQGVAHERVVAWFVDNAQIIPVSLFTLYSSVDALRDETTRNGERVAAELERFHRKREWDLKISFRADIAEQHAAQLSPSIAQLDEDIARAAPGRRFLLEKKRKDLLRQEVAQAASRTAHEIIDELRPMTEDVVVAPLPRAAAELPVVANTAFLVRQDKEQELRSAVHARAESLRALGVELTFSGPWAPYRFLSSGK